MPLTRLPISDEEKARWVKYYTIDGYSVNDIRNLFHRDAKVVSQHLKKLGILKPRKGRENGTIENYG
jgi:transposase